MISRRSFIFGSASALIVGASILGYKFLDKKGRGLYIYKWGAKSGGNDWCFVRTPENYTEYGKKHEFVVLNHGNGWVMNGTEATANFSGSTQFGVDQQNNGAYLNKKRADYVEFSSPLIEKLLNNGYVVCGAQNDNGMPDGASAGWGADIVRNNIKDFVFHIKNNFNVTEYCHMVGASNGGLATLNAAMIMPEKSIKSITLMYPVTNLYAAWKYSHRESVEAAYGITPNSFYSFLKKTSGHDPMSAFTSYRVNDKELNKTSAIEYTSDIELNKIIVKGKLYSEPEFETDRISVIKMSTFTWPKILCYYSMQDRTLDMDMHWIPFRSLLQNGGHKYKDIRVTGDHGGWMNHDDTDTILAWMS
ncbi:TPA: hypothetical protein ACRRXY_003398 [Morganella morganii]